MTDEELVPQVLDDETTLVQALDARVVRASTCSNWPPEPPLPADADDSFADSTLPPARHAGIFAAVRRPTTSSELT